MANKKITQLASKSSVLSTDLFPIGDATTGTLYKKTIAELQAAIGGAVVSVNGKVGVVVLTTDDVTEAVSPTNLYFTNTRARGAISLTTIGSSGASTYSSSTGVLNVPTYTLAGLGGITATFLSGTSGVSYNSSTGVISFTGTVYTDTSIKALLSATAPLSFNSTTGAFTISQATTSSNGYLSSTDWNTFNGKQSALTNPVTGTSTSGYVAFFNGSTTITGDSGHFWDNTNKRLGIGTTSPSYPLHIYSTTNLRLNIEGTTNFVATQYNNTGGAFYMGIDDSAGANFTGSGYARFLYSGGSYPMIFTTNGSERMRITSGGNVGIGCTPTTVGAYQVLEVSNSTGAIIRFTTSTTSGGYLAGTSGGIDIDTIGASTAIRFYTQGSQKMTILNGGNVGIGTTSPSYLLTLGVSTGDAVGGTTALAITTNGQYGVSADKKYLNINFVGYNNGIRSQIQSWDESGNTTNGVLVFNTNIGGTLGERFRIAVSSGNMLLGTTTDNGERLYVSGAIRATGTITANSDITLKKNLLKIKNALEKVEQINGYTYEFKEDDSKRHAGVIAQEIQEVLPEIVNKGNDGILGVEYGNISALLIEAIKDLKSQNESLQARLVALEK